MVNRSIPALDNGKFSGRASADIDDRVAAVEERVMKQVAKQIASGLASKVDASEFQAYLDSVGTPPAGDGNGTVASVAVVDNGDGTLTIG